MRIKSRYGQAEDLAKFGKGIYNVTLEKPYEEEINGEMVIWFPFTVGGITGETKPFYFHLFKSEVNDKGTKLGYSNSLAESIRKCFDIILPFEEKNYEYWEGREGRVNVLQIVNGKTKEVFFYKNKNLSEVRKKIIEDMYDFRKASL